MKQYRILISDLAKTQIVNAKRYIKLKFKNKQALKRLCADIIRTKESLKYSAGSARVYDIEKGTRVIHLQMNYKFIFSFVDRDTVLIEEFIHDLQDKKESTQS